MTPALSPNTQAILLLTAPLIVGRSSVTYDPLKLGEYKRLAAYLREIKHQPADFISPDAAELLHACRAVIDEQRLRKLLGRGFALSQAIERWQSRAIWVISRADAEYPRRLKTRLRDDAPAVFYGCGNMALLETGGLAVVGSRHVDNVLIDYTLSIGTLAARSGKTIVSGGAKGIDQAAMRGALEGGGKVCGVLADSLEKTTMNREQRTPLLDGQLVLISPYDPSARFNVGNAMQRNKLIYALADIALVVSSDLKKGGTWAGAAEQLDKLKFVPVFIRSSGEPSVGLDGLREKGALPWSDPQDMNAFEDVFNVALPRTMVGPQDELALISNEGVSAANGKPTALKPPEAAPMPQAQSELSASDGIISDAQRSAKASEEPPPVITEAIPRIEEAKESPQPQLTLAEELFAAVSAVIQQLTSEPIKDADVAAALDVSNAQAKAWLQRLVDEGVIEKQSRPVQYVVRRPDLFSR